METTLTARQIKELGLWSKICEYKGWEYLSYDRVDENELITFDSTFEKEKISENEHVLRKIEEAKSIIEDIYNDCKIYDNQRTLSSVLDMLCDIKDATSKNV